MRCQDVIGEIAVPTGTIDPARVADHLDSCAGCAEWAQRNDALDQLWHATAPAEPTQATWDAMWGTLTSALDRESGTHFSPLAGSSSTTASCGSPALSSPWRRSALGVFFVAQAAALLLGLGLALQATRSVQHQTVASASTTTTTTTASPAPSLLANRPAPPAASFHEIAQLQTTVISLDNDTSRHLELNELANEVDGFYAMHGAMESLATLQ